MRSVFVISLPRSLSSLTYQAVREALRLSAPAWVSDGEVLNHDRYAMHGDPRFQLGRKYTRPAEEPQLAAALHAFLDQVIQPEGFIYKDVVQPFVIAGWLARAGNQLSVLRIRRPITDVALSMLERRWLYPAKPPWSDGVESALLRGLLDAQAALDSVPGAVDVDYDALIHDETALLNAVRTLAPEAGLGAPSYFGPGFAEYRENRLARRNGQAWQILRTKLEELGATV
ncbi:MAG TPA: hypothetical protein VKB93_08175 [Thermoanaerobaculia bacterium]|nr:hypothetical protein [Thermoanaerobaculia bacterium]